MLLFTPLISTLKIPYITELLPLISQLKLPLISTSDAVKIPDMFSIPSSQTLPELLPIIIVGVSFEPLIIIVTS